MAKKQSNQEKRLAKGLAKVVQTTTDDRVLEAAQTKLLELQESAEEQAAGNDGGGEVTELPELVPDVPSGMNPEADGYEPPAPTPEAPKATGPVLQVKQGLTLRGGRGEWYKLLCKYDGKPVADYIAEGKANPASRYTARSTKCGQPKTPESRLSWFKRAGIVTIK